MLYPLVQSNQYLTKSSVSTWEKSKPLCSSQNFAYKEQQSAKIIVNTVCLRKALLEASAPLQQFEKK